MEKLVYFQLANGHKVFGKFNTETREIRLPSGYLLPVFDNGYVFYMGETVQVKDVNGNPII